MRILLLEDDQSLGRSIKAWLELDGYAVDWLSNGDLAEPALLSHEYACVILDRGLPNISGDTILQNIRKSGSSLPILILSARVEVSDRITGLDLGGDDYLLKPCDLNELSARVRVLTRRRLAHPAPLFECGELTLDPKGKQVMLAGKLINITSREFAVLQKLIMHPGLIVSRSQLEESLYGWGDEVESNAIEVYIYNLRRKIGAYFIKTVRGQGYRLVN